MISFLFWLIFTLVVSHPTHGEQDDSCSVQFNNIHNGYTYKLTGKCRLTQHSFQIVTETQEPGNFDKVEQIHRDVLIRTVEKTYSLKMDHIEPGFSAEEDHKTMTVHFIMQYSGVRSVVMQMSMRVGLARVFQNYLRHNMRGSTEEL